MTKRTIRKVVSEYNKYRSPEAVVSFVGTKRNSIIMNLYGKFCLTCGFYDYFDDLKFELQKAGGQPVDIKAIKEKHDGNFTAIFSVRPLVG